MWSLSVVAALLWTTSVLVNGAFVTRLSDNNRNEDTERKNGIFTTQQNAFGSSPASRRFAVVTNDGTTIANDEALDVVLMGIGDLRTDDHIGLYNALQQKSSRKILPIAVLSDDLIQNIPGVVAHTVDTANLLSATLYDVDKSLQIINPNLKLHYVEGTNVVGTLQDLLSDLPNINTVRIHVCDLGDADNNLGYGPYGQLRNINHNDDNEIPWEIIPWHQSLRNEPLKDLSQNFPDSFPDYERQYTSGIQPLQPIDLQSLQVSGDEVISIPKYQSIPTNTRLLEKFIKLLALDETRCQSEQCSGIYRSHWGGLEPGSVSGSVVLQTIKSYVQNYKENDEQFLLSTQGSCTTSNQRSLEHAAMKWQLQNGQWLAGESITRYLAAPLLFGTISPRRVWYVANQNAKLFNGSSPFFPISPLKQMVEASEWHRLLASKLIRTDPAYNTSDATTTTGPKYKYWRYQGFLCRYAVTCFDESTANDDKNGILLVHGFGASGAQWNKAMKELSKQFADNTDVCQQGLAPDLIGFGHSEKPSISYTGYMWDSQVMDFSKEIAIGRFGWKSFVVGGNSIGGFTSLSMAASDSASVSGQEVSSNGAPGTHRCSGLVLMNSAGPVKTADEIHVEITAQKDTPLQSIAQITAQGRLPLCSPPPRPIARAFGIGLLAYLKPQIQSICRNLYPTNPDAVDSELCEAILRDSLDPGAIYVMMSGAKLPTPRTANELLAGDFGSAPASSETPESVFTGPVLIAQGVLDPLNDSTDRMNRFAALRDDITADPIQAGHCPHDEQPGLVAKSIATWMISKKPFVNGAKTTQSSFSPLSVTRR